MKKQIPGAFSENEAAPVGDRKSKNMSKPLIYFSTSKGELCSYEPRSKAKKTLANVGDYVVCLAECGDWVCFSSENRLHSYNLQTGEQKVTRTSGTARHLTELDGILYFELGSSLYSCSPQTGEQKAVAHVGHFIDCITKSDGKVYFGAYKELHSYDPGTGKRKRVAKFDGNIDHLAGCNDVLFLGMHKWSDSPPDPFMGPAWGKGGVYSCKPEKLFRKRKLIAEVYEPIQYMAGHDEIVYFSMDGYPDHRLYSYEFKTKERKLVLRNKFPVYNVVECGDSVYLLNEGKLRHYNRAGELEPPGIETDHITHMIAVKGE